jgi:FAD binding domain
MWRFRKGFRFGNGSALAGVRPGSLIEQWRALKACIAVGKIVIMQAANTGLTGGSTPDGDRYDREIIIISTMRIDKIHVIENGNQVICLPGATLFELERKLQPLGRNPHSAIGSSCIGASVFGGTCNNSGGALMHRGPAYTQMTLYAQVDQAGQIHLVNHLGIRLEDDPETILMNVEKGAFRPEDIQHDSNRSLYGLEDSPVGLAGWILDHDDRSYKLIARVFDGQPEGLTRDDILDSITLYWLTNTAVSSARSYWDYSATAKKGFFDVKGAVIPVAVSAFPDEIYTAPRSWAEKAYPKLIYYNKLPKGGHFAAWEQPQFYSEEVRTGLRSLRQAT